MESLPQESRISSKKFLFCHNLERPWKRYQKLFCSIYCSFDVEVSEVGSCNTDERVTTSDGDGTGSEKRDYKNEFFPTRSNVSTVFPWDWVLGDRSQFKKERVKIVVACLREIEISLGIRAVMFQKVCCMCNGWFAYWCTFVYIWFPTEHRTYVHI